MNMAIKNKKILNIKPRMKTTIDKRLKKTQKETKTIVRKRKCSKPLGL